MKPLNRTCGHGFHYMADGGGRDTYILHDHGGTCKAKAVMPANQCFRGNGGSVSPPRPQINMKLSGYTSDGSGRDGYVFYRGAITPSQPFHKTLRAGTQPTGTRRSFKHLARRTLETSLQASLVNRLSCPKSRAAKHPNSVTRPTGFFAVNY